MGRGTTLALTHTTAPVVFLSKILFLVKKPQSFIKVKEKRSPEESSDIFGLYVSYLLNIQTYVG